MFGGLFLIAPDSAQASRIDVSRIKAAYMSADFSQAIAQGEQALAGASKHEQGLDELYYLLGLSYLKEGNVLRASDIFEIIIKEFPRSPLHESAQLGLADTMFLTNDFGRAEAAYKNLLETKSRAVENVELFVRLKQLYLKQGDVRLASHYEALLRKEYPLYSEISMGHDQCALPPQSKNTELFYSVQVGSFGQEDNAIKLRQQLLHKRYPAFIEEVTTVQGVVMYKVRVGKYASLREAELLQDELKSLGFPTQICP